MNITDILFGLEAPSDLKRAILEVMDLENITDHYLPVLVPSATNNDVNGSQHHPFDVDFTYREATDDDLAGTANLGYYEYFSQYYSKVTGHYYQGDGNHFAALVLNPPAYAIITTV